MTLLLLAAAVSFAGYRIIQGKYIVYHRAETLFLAGDFKAAIPLFTQALEMGLKLPAAQRHLGDSYLAAKDFQKALKPYQSYTKQRPSDYQALAKLAMLYNLLGREPEALVLMKKALAANRGDPGLWLTLAGLYRERKAYGPAEQAYLNALKLKPGLPAAIFGLAETYAWQKNYGKALDLYRGYLKDHPKDRTARFNLARILSWQGDFDRAIRQYGLVLEEKK